MLTGSILGHRQHKIKEVRLTPTCVLNHQFMVSISSVASEKEEIKQALPTILNYPILAFFLFVCFFLGLF